MKKTKKTGPDPRFGDYKTTIGGQALIEGLMMIGPEPISSIFFMSLRLGT